MTASPPSPGLTGAQWKDSVGQGWAALHPLMERMYRPIGDAVAEKAGVVAGERVLDIGCGAGATTLDLARRVGPEGHALGVDIAPTLLAAARAAAEAQDLPQVAFLEADAQTHPFEAAFDAVTSRFGVMFFEDPTAAFANLRRAARVGGRLAFAAWRSPADNALGLVPVEAALPLLPPKPPSAPNAPGRFAFADQDYVHGILEAAGWRDIAIAPLDVATPVTLDELAQMTLQLGTLGPLLKGQPEAVHAEVRETVYASLRPHEVDGVIPLEAACWLVSARA